MVQASSRHRRRYTLLRESRRATSPVTVANSFKNTVLSASRRGGNVDFASFFFAVIIQEVSLAPTPATILSLRSSIGSTQRGAPRQEILGPKRAAPLRGTFPWWLPNPAFSMPAFPSGETQEGCRNLGARSLACQEANCLHILQEQHPCLGRGRKRQNK